MAKRRITGEVLWYHLPEDDKEPDRNTPRRHFRKWCEENKVPYRCSTPDCPTGDPPTWMGQPIVLEMDHKSGNPADNAPHNLCWLCPNCHSQQGKKGGGNKGKIKDETESGYGAERNDGTTHFHEYGGGGVVGGGRGTEG